MRNLGVSPGDVVHLVLGNHNHIYPFCFGLWMIGATSSLADPNLDAKTIAKQLEQIKVQLNACPSTDSIRRFLFQAKWVICGDQTEALVNDSCTLLQSTNIRKISLGPTNSADITNLRAMAESLPKDARLNKFILTFYMPYMSLNYTFVLLGSPKKSTTCHPTQSPRW